MVDLKLLHKELKSRGLDLDRIVDAFGKPIEPKIKPLVIALNYKGYKTTGSCEGHTISEHKRRLSKALSDGDVCILNEGKRVLVFKQRELAKPQMLYAAPWVDLDLREDQGKALTNIMSRYNDSSDINWYLTYSTVQKELYVIDAEPTHDLEVLQADISRLAERILQS